uniref:glucuronosyltransferase n=1 Tax=Panagrellus redivivus TaxID=6233 RepID=A0A7E5A0B5_PANRE
MSELTAIKKPKLLLYVFTTAFSHVQFAFTIGEWLVNDGFEVHVIVQKMLPGDTCDVPKCFAKTYNIEASGKIAPDFMTQLAAGANNLITCGFHAESTEVKCDMWRNFVESADFEELKRENYEIVVGEYLSTVSITAFLDIGIKKFINITALPFNSMLASSIGLPTQSSYVPFMDECMPCGDDMGFWERAWNFYTNVYAEWYLLPKWEKVEDKILRKMGYSDPKVARMNAKKCIDLRVFNSNLLLDYPRPTASNILHVGGSMTKQPEKLTGDIAAVFKKPSDGVILISFGTIAESSDFPKAFRPSVLATMKALPTYEFIFRVGNVDDHPEFKELPNVTMVKWMDQVSILAHPKTKLFYTHCGLNSLNESLSFGVPLVATPIFGDQHYNASLLRKKNVGIVVDLLTITPAKLISAFKTVLADAEYAKEAKQIAQKTKDLPIQPKETFLRWVNYISKHGASKDFALKSVTMPYAQLHSIDVIFVLVVAFVAFISLSIVLLSNFLNVLF